METVNGYATEDLDFAIERAGADAWRQLDGANLFLTGGSGFFGAWLLSTLQRARAHHGHKVDVTVLTRDAASFRARAPQLATGEGVHLLEGDVRFFEFPKGRFSHVLHAATDTSRHMDRDPLGLIDTIVDGTRRVLRFAREQGGARFLLTSSGAVYGPQPPEVERFHESHPHACPTTDPRAHYGQAKRLAEQLCTLFRHHHGLPVIIARCFTMAGPGMVVDGHFALGNFIRDAVAGRPVRVRGDGSPVRSYLYTADLTAWLLRLLTMGQDGEVYNTGSDQAIRLAELAERVAHLAGGQGVLLDKAPENPERHRYVPDIDKARQALGLDVWTGLDAMVQRTAHWLRTRPSAPPAPAPVPPRPLTFVIDVDGVVASLTPGNDYRLAQPLAHHIASINRLHDAGHRIVLFTARGSETGIDWKSVTEEQCRRWGLKYHDLRFGKPAGNHYVDDRLLPPLALEKLAASLADGPLAPGRPA